MKKKYSFLFFIMFCTLTLAACGEAKDPAVSAVENYINALVKKDLPRMSALSCAQWEDDARMEYDSFQAIATKLDGLSCEATSTGEKDTTAVFCEGKIIATYDNEDQDFDLSGRAYTVINQGGEFLVCGYQE